MRLRRLDLVRYGRFTDQSLDLPAAGRDLHVIFGPNEAGKSTALAAIEDLLFGIPARSPYNFLHDYGSLRIGAVIEHGGESLEVMRRKGRKDTLLGPDGIPQAGGEGVLNPCLAGADRPFFERMYSLDHVRLRVGGQEILDARNDVGQTLFSAGAGIVGLRSRLEGLEKEADHLWGFRHARHRRFYVARDRLRQAEEEVRAQTVTVGRWQELKRAHDQAERVHAGIDARIRAASVERSRLGRIRRVLRGVRRKQECDAQLAALDGVPVLPEDAAATVAGVEREEAAAESRAALLEEQLTGARRELEALPVDERLLLRAADIGQLHERRIEIRGEKADLPKREAELVAAHEALRANAVELGWDETEAEPLMARIPARTRVRAVRALLGERGKLEGEVVSEVRRLQEAREALAALQAKLEQAGEPADASRLAVAVRTVRERGDLAGRIRAAEKALEDARERVRRRLQALDPGGLDDAALAALRVPPAAAVQQQRERGQDWERRRQAVRQEAEAAGQELDLAVSARERAVRGDRVVTLEELENARRRRDALWSLIKTVHVEGGAVADADVRGLEADPGELPRAFEPAVARADELADRRFDRAEAAGRLAELDRKIGELEARRRLQREQEARLAEEGGRLEAEWTAAWQAAPFRPGSPAAMLEWMEARQAVLDAVAERVEAESALALLRVEAREAREQITGELAAAGAGEAVRETDGLSVILERAAEVQRRCEAEADRKQQLEADAARAEREVEHRERELAAAEGAWSRWQESWAAALDQVGLARDPVPEAVVAQIEVIDQMRETAGHARSLRHDRINKIRRDLADFEREVGALVRDLDPELLGQPAEDAVLELEQRLAAARRVQALRQKKAEEVDRLAAAVAELAGKRRERMAAVAHLKAAARAETRTALMAAIDRSDQWRVLDRERKDILGRLEQDGDGKSVEELVEECTGAAMDEVGAQEQSVEAALEDLRGQQTAAAEERSRARAEFLAVGGKDAAARAAANRQEALAEMRHTAERYVRVKTAATLLRWAIDRYRHEKQAPLLRRAGSLFAALTGGAFRNLRVEYDDQDRAGLLAVRPDQRTVPVDGMSTGTADQLYLALRVASVEDYLERGNALPFVADDLFINFDDDRAAAGLTLLGDLSQSTQVLFFTHHRHLVDLAQRVLGDQVNLITLQPPEAGGNG